MAAVSAVSRRRKSRRHLVEPTFEALNLGLVHGGFSDAALLLRSGDECR
jgi:hypothetical protein